MAASRCGAAASAVISRGEAVRGEVVLRDPDGAAGALQHAGIGELVLIERMRQRHQDRGPADGREFGNRRGAGARNHQMARRHARRQIGKERRDLGGDRGAGVGFAHALEILLARLLDDSEARAQAGIEPADARPARYRP